MKDNYTGFTLVENSFVITLSNGVWRQVDLYERNRMLFAKHGGGYIALNNDGATSAPKVKWKEISGVNFHAKPGFFGQLSKGDDDE